MNWTKERLKQLESQHYELGETIKELKRTIGSRKRTYGSGQVVL